VVFRSARRNANGRVALTLPVNSAIGGLLPGIGDFSAHISGGGALANDEPAQTQFDSGFGWAPVRGINLNASMGMSSTPPSSDLIAAPLVETPNVRVYDFVTGERAEVVSVTGGNADLLAARTSTLDLRLALYPSFAKGLTLQTLFRRMVVRDAVGTIPALTSAVEEAFPDRIFRDGEGHLLRVDTRPINIARSASKTLSTNLAWQIGLGEGKLPASDEDSDKASAAPPGKAFTGGRRTLSLGLNHIWTLRQDQLLRAGLPPLDRLAGEGGAGPARHRVSAKAVVNLGGIGVDADLGWASPTVARNPGREGRPETKLDFSSKTQLDVRLFASPARLGGDAAGREWAKGLRLSLDIDNLFDQRVSVVDQDREVPAGFTRDEIDPFGRTVKFSVRKLF
jgi:outer membrane receptor protein involved in Fe transport